MANTTIYPYGTNGQLPSSIGVINDLTTGGADKALSAEMGKTLAAREANDRTRIDAIIAILKKSVFTEDQSAAFTALDAMANAVDSISVSPSTIASDGEAKGTTHQLTATTFPTGGTVSWSSGDTSVATVDSTGLVTIVGNGTATITATSGNVSATCSVSVSNIVMSYVEVSMTLKVTDKYLYATEGSTVQFGNANGYKVYEASVTAGDTLKIMSSANTGAYCQYAIVDSNNIALSVYKELYGGSGIKTKTDIVAPANSAKIYISENYKANGEGTSKLYKLQ